MDTAITTPERLQELINAYRTSRIILTAFELGVFTAVGTGDADAARVARAVGADERGTDRLMNALCAIGLLEKRGGRFFNTPFGAERLVRGAPRYLEGIRHSVNLWDTWHTLTDAVRAGHTVVNGDPACRDPNWFEGFIAAMHQRASAQAPRMIECMDLDGVMRAIDIGGGSGAYAIALARAREGLRCTVFDLPNVIELARGYVGRAGMLERIDFVAGDFNADDFGVGYDMALLSAIIHMNSPDGNRRLFAKIAACLNPGGRLVVQDFVMNDDRTGPAVGALFALNMLVGTSAGDTYTAAEIESWMREAGCARTEARDTPFDASLVIGWK
ncbi:MAG TPA: methyltransferase [Spirochaetota bacterium]|mgnify:CR=1 FL=1|nr:methyltransferase [Spirochaetota bacterium]HPU89101.1 methyltransferase [Spirochaetota bacterium]